MLDHLARRFVVEQVKAVPHDTPIGGLDLEDFDMPRWGFGLMMGTFLLWLALTFSIDYTVNHLLVNLTVIESPTTDTVATYTHLYIDDPDYPSEKKDEDEEVYTVEIETATVHSRPLTHSIRRTIAHLKTVAGAKSRWRGLGTYMLYSVVTGITQLVVSVLPIPAAPFLGTLAAAVVGARLHCAWTHQTITMPRDKSIKQRRVPCSKVKHLIGPSILRTLSLEAFVTLIILNTFFAWNQIQDMTPETGYNVPVLLFWTILQPSLIAVAAFFVLVLPAQIILIRREASLLPAEEETIVPMDRTFGGYLYHAEDVLSIRDALKGFTGEAWRRLIKLNVKYFFITVAMVLFLAQMLIVELWLIMGDQIMQVAATMDARVEQGKLGAN